MTTSADIRLALHRRFPPQQYVCIEEAPIGPGRNGGIDFVAISCWKSRGYEIDAIEIKVSYPDWKHEREQRDGVWIGTAKNYLWVQRSHHFWIACPANLAPRILPELPVGWGILAVGDQVTIHHKAERRRNPDPLAWSEVVGLLRAQQGAGWNPMRHEFDRGWDLGYRRGCQDTEAKHRRLEAVCHDRKAVLDIEANR